MDPMLWITNPYRPPPYDPEKAKQLVQEVFPGKKPEIIMHSFPFGGVPELMRVGEAISGYWNEIGVKTKIIPSEYPTYRGLLGKKDSPKLANCVAPMRFGNRLLWDAAFNLVYHSNGLLSTAKDPKIDELVTDLLAERDVNKLGGKAHNIAVYLNENWYQIPLMEVGSLYASNPKKVPSWPNISAPLAYDLYFEDLYKK